jgi:hypothetical protein
MASAEVATGRVMEEAVAVAVAVRVLIFRGDLYGLQAA